MKRNTASILVLGVIASACGGPEPGPVYTLYRNSLAVQGRVHIATFDAKESGSYNMENCNLAVKLFQSQPGVSVRFWCEPGSFKP